MTQRCELCPRRCVIEPGRSGDCRVRVNMDGRLCAVTYGYPCAVHVDPIEKKPLYHYRPASTTFSLATAGCNLHCKNCQNWEISQQGPLDVPAVDLPPEQVPRLASGYDCTSVSYTYTDPVVYYEYVMDSARAAREAGLGTILVTAGYINPAPARELFRLTDVARVDLKSMSERFYADICGATLAPVLETLVLARSMGLHVEVVHLVIPTLNDADDDFRALCRWICENLGREVPLHFSAFHPQYRMRHLPATPVETLRRARDVARGEGVRYVYLGNVMEDEGGDTHCPRCARLLVRRRGFQVVRNDVSGGKCPSCAETIYGVWE